MTKLYTIFKLFSNTYKTNNDKKTIKQKFRLKKYFIIKEKKRENRRRTFANPDAQIRGCYSIGEREIANIISFSFYI